MQVNVKDFDSNTVHRFSGDSGDCLQWLQVHYPESTKSSETVDEAVSSINQSGYYEAEVVEPQNGNLLPVDYLTHDQRDAYPHRHSDDGSEDEDSEESSED